MRARPEREQTLVLPHLQPLNTQADPPVITRSTHRPTIIDFDGVNFL